MQRKTDSPADETAQEQPKKRDTKRRDLSEKVDKRRRRKFKGVDGKQHWAQGKGARADSAASKALLGVVKKHGPAGPGARGDASVREYLTRWLSIKRGEVRFATHRRYRYQAEKYIAPVIGQMKIADCRPSDMEAVAAAAGKEGPATRNGVVYILRAIFNLAEHDGALYANYSKSDKRVKDSAEKRRAFTEDEDKLIKAHFNDTDCIAMPILYYTGIRRGELYGLQWRFINFNARELVVDQQAHETDSGFVVDRELKTENSRRTVPIPDELMPILRSARGHRNAFIIQREDGAHYNQRDIEYMLDHLRERTGMQDLIHHTFRHNYATQLYLAGVPVKEAAIVMGETIEVMMRTYVHIERQLGAVQKDLIRGAFKKNVANKLPSASSGSENSEE